MGKFMDIMNSSGGGALIGGASGLLSGIGRKQRERRQVGYQKDLMNQQLMNQRGLNQQGHDLQMDMWNKTNYGAQMEHIKGAGLNPGLMYGMSGGGGTTAGSQGGGGAQSGGAPQVKESDVSGQGAIMGLQNAGQLALMKAQENKLNAEAKKIGGVDTDQTSEAIKKLIAETGTEGEKKMLVVAQKALANMQSKNVKANTNKIGKDIEVAEQERLLKKYEVDLNKQNIQKTDNKIFRWLTKTAADNGYELQSLINEFLGKKDEKKPIKGLEIKKN
tara:strand:+ start:336 stop:1160 length:825 start_codon:yes stop_codon:yes gene_type:complete